MKLIGPFALLLFIFTGEGVFADVKGQFKVGSEVMISPKHAAAYPTRNQFYPREFQIEVVLAEGAIDTKAIVEALDPHTNVINQDQVRAGNYILLWVSPKGQVSMNATLAASMTQYGDSTEEGALKAELTANTPDRVAGRIFTTKPSKTISGETYEVDVTFDTAISRGPAGTKIPAGGGEAGQAFLSLYKSVEKRDEKGIRSGVTEEIVQMLFKDYNTPEENLNSAIEMLKAWLPKKNPKVTRGEMHSGFALLEVEGEVFEGTDALYVVKMNKASSGWLFNQAAMAGILRK